MNGPFVSLASPTVDPAELRFENSFVRELPADPVLANTPRRVFNACYTRVAPTPVAAPCLLAWSICHNAHSANLLDAAAGPIVAPVHRLAARIRPQTSIVRRGREGNSYYLP